MKDQLSSALHRLRQNRLTSPVTKRILSRYALTVDQRIIIDISVSRIEDLFDNYDRIAPYIIAAWVSLWESLAVLLVDWSPHRQSIRLFQRIAAAPVTLQPLETPTELEQNAPASRPSDPHR